MTDVFPVIASLCPCCVIRSLLLVKRKGRNVKSYILSIALATVLGAVMNILTPDKWQKYVGVVTGLVVMLSIAGPIISLIGNDTLSGISYTAETTRTRGEYELYNKVKAELIKRINDDVAKRLKAEFGRTCTAKAEVEMTASGEVRGVETIHIYGDKIDAVAVGRLREVYGAKEVKYVGFEKAAQKSE